MIFQSELFFSKIEAHVSAHSHRVSIRTTSPRAPRAAIPWKNLASSDSLVSFHLNYAKGRQQEIHLNWIISKSLDH